MKEKVYGKILFPELSQDQDIEYKVDLKGNSDKSEHQLLKKEMEKVGMKIVLSKIEEFLTEFKSGANLKKEGTPTPTFKKESNFNTEPETISTSLIVKETFNTDIKTIFESFVDSKKINAYTQAQVDVDLKIGGKFSILNGKLTGEYLKIIPYSEIQKKLRFSNWKENEYSILNILLEEDEDGKTVLTLKQTNLPSYVNTNELQGFWKENFTQRIGIMFGGLLKF